MAQIHFNGRDYDLVTLDQFTMDEDLVLWDYAHISADQVSEMEGFHPGVICALIHVSVARGEPDEKPRTIRKMVGGMPRSELETVFAGISEETEQEDERLPPPSAPDGKPDANASNSISGEGSLPTGAQPPAPGPAAGTGSRGLATGATSDLATSAA